MNIRRFATYLLCLVVAEAAFSPAHHSGPGVAGGGRVSRVVESLSPTLESPEPSAIRDPRCDFDAKKTILGGRGNILPDDGAAKPAAYLKTGGNEINAGKPASSPAKAATACE